MDLQVPFDACIRHGNTMSVTSQNDLKGKLFVSSVWDTLSEEQEETIKETILKYVRGEMELGKKLGSGVSRTGYRISNSLVCKRSRMGANAWGEEGSQSRHEFYTWMLAEKLCSKYMEYLSPSIAMWGNGELVFQFYCSDLTPEGMHSQSTRDVVDSFGMMWFEEKELRYYTTDPALKMSDEEMTVLQALACDNHAGNIRRLSGSVVKIDYGF